MINPLIHQDPVVFGSLTDVGDASVGGILTTAAVVDSGSLAETGLINPTALTGTFNDWAPTGFASARHVYLTTSGSTTINGIAGGTDGRVITLLSDPAAGNAIVITHETAGSLAANRIQLVGGSSWTLTSSSGAPATLTLRYNGTAQRWQQVNGSTSQINSTMTFGGTTTISGPLNVATTVTPSALPSGVTNDWNPAPSGQVEVRATPASGGSLLSSISSGAGNSGRIIIITNIATAVRDTLTLTHDDGATGTAGNRFLFANGQANVIPPGGTLTLRFDAVSTRWRPIDTPPAMNAPFAMPFQSGRYYFVPNYIGTTTSSGSGTGTLRCAPFWVPNLITVQRIGAEVTTIGDVGSKVRLGIYADDGTGRPGALLVDAGTIAGDSATVQEIILGTPLTLPPGMYWIAGVVQLVTTTQPTLRFTASAGITPGIDAGTAIPTAGLVSAGFSQAAVTGALPATFTGTSVASGPIRMFIKVA